MKIPASFNLHGLTYTVAVVKAKDWTGTEEEMGYLLPSQCAVAIKESAHQIMEHTFLHELTHAILSHMEHDLYSNETFVNVFAGLLHQALNSSAYK